MTKQLLQNVFSFKLIPMTQYMTYWRIFKKSYFIKLQKPNTGIRVFLKIHHLKMFSGISIRFPSSYKSWYKIYFIYFSHQIELGSSIRCQKWRYIQNLTQKKSPSNKCIFLFFFSNGKYRPPLWTSKFYHLQYFFSQVCALCLFS